MNISKNKLQIVNTFCEFCWKVRHVYKILSLCIIIKIRTTLHSFSCNLLLHIFFADIKSIFYILYSSEKFSRHNRNIQLIVLCWWLKLHLEIIQISLAQAKFCSKIKNIRIFTHWNIAFPFYLLPFNYLNLKGNKESYLKITCLLLNNF